jgi:C4-dicarboxylate-specific signal transduction histidine kinase
VEILNSTTVPLLKRLVPLSVFRTTLSLRWTFVLFVLLLQLFSVVAVVATVRNTMGRAIERQADELLQHQLLAASIRVTNLLSQASESLVVLQNAADAGQLDMESTGALERQLFYFLQASPHIAAIRMATTDGRLIILQRGQEPSELTTVILVGPKDLAISVERDRTFTPLSRNAVKNTWGDSRDSDWYQGASKAFGNFWTEAHQSELSGRFGLSVARSFAVEGILKGVISIDIEVRSLKPAFRDSIVNDDGALLILNRQGRVIAYGSSRDFKEDLTLEALSQSGDSVPQRAFQDSLDIQKPKVDVLNEETHERSSISHLSILQPFSYSTLPWLIGLYTPEDSLTGELWSNQGVIPYIALAIFTLTSLLAFPIVAKIIKPIAQFSSLTETASIDGRILASRIRAPYSELSTTEQTLNREITQRRTFQAAYLRTFESSSRSMARVDLVSYQFLQVNSRLCQLLSLKEEELLAHGLNDIIVGRQLGMLENFGKAILDDREFSIDVGCLGGDGAQLWLRLTALLIRDHLGVPDHALVLMDDIAVERNAENRLNALRNDLYHVGRVNVMGQLAEGLAHELNQPLSAIVHDIDSANFALRAPDVDLAELRVILRDIDSHAHRAGGIIRALRNLIRKEGDVEEVFDFGELLDQTRMLMDGEARQNDVVLDFGATLTLVRGSRIQLAQVLVNLVRNAIEALAAANVPKRVIKVRGSSEGPIATIVVEDNGLGFAAGRKPFTKFETTRPQGLGLGLSICQSLVEANGGTIRYERVDPQGARFVITLVEQMNVGGRHGKFTG